eukprot:TRINITY_DN109778_c0_g1_i1.p1 TRINITY_DN109778_c0_g1~~TRINITY_DN109778_c0_g1_i1.p1  ORF type:complete len:505 (-),score=83.88 TRINITY_DN109778_c0_g1_i1:488-2002(-)
MAAFRLAAAGCLASAWASTPPSAPSSEPQGTYLNISAASLADKLDGFWVGQLVGNFMGLPFEFVYMDEPMPLLPETYYDNDSATAAGLKCNFQDPRGFIPKRFNELQGSYTDDDTDIEFVTLHTVMEHGLNVTYAQIARAWQQYVHIKVAGGDALWFANKVARENMDKGLLPPATGSQENNQYWWTIDPQLVNEIWSAFYPGMLEKAVDRAQWGAEITSSSWGTHPTRFYAALYSAAFFESNVTKMYDIAMHYIPRESPFLAGLWEVKELHAAHPEDWRTVRQIIKQKYLYYPSNCDPEATNTSGWNNCWVGAMINGLLGAMALLYGEGDFLKTVGIAIAAGFDCDNQAATLAGLLGVVHGGSAIPRSLTHQVAGNNWTTPFNDVYVNERRLPLPANNSIAEIVANITSVTRKSILANGGLETSHGNETMYSVLVSNMLVHPSDPPLPTSNLSDNDTSKQDGSNSDGNESEKNTSSPEVMSGSNMRFLPTAVLSYGIVFGLQVC